MNTIVISNVHREPLVWPYVQDMKPIRTFTPDWPYHCIGQFRCFHGHTQALTCYMTDDTACVMEDDCVPYEDTPWKDVINAANQLVLDGSYEIVCLHGRGFDFNKFDNFDAHGFNWLKPKTEYRWVLGTLIYVIGKNAAKKFIDSDFWLHGTNIDLFLWSHLFNFCMIDPCQFEQQVNLQKAIEHPKPFKHDRHQGSIIENPKNVECVIR